ncbi:hypothetical protein [Spirochaeta dissipatitropha]
MKRQRVCTAAVLCALLMAVALVGMGCDTGIFEGDPTTGGGDGQVGDTETGSVENGDSQGDQPGDGLDDLDDEEDPAFLVQPAVPSRPAFAVDPIVPSDLSDYSSVAFVSGDDDLERILQAFMLSIFAMTETDIAMDQELDRVGDELLIAYASELEALMDFIGLMESEESERPWYLGEQFLLDLPDIYFFLTDKTGDRNIIVNAALTAAANLQLLKMDEDNGTTTDQLAIAMNGILYAQVHNDWNADLDLLGQTLIVKDLILRIQAGVAGSALVAVDQLGDDDSEMELSLGFDGGFLVTLGVTLDGIDNMAGKYILTIAYDNDFTSTLEDFEVIFEADDAEIPDLEGILDALDHILSGFTLSAAVYDNSGAAIVNIQDISLEELIAAIMELMPEPSVEITVQVSVAEGFVDDKLLGDGDFHDLFFYNSNQLQNFNHLGYAWRNYNDGYHSGWEGDVRSGMHSEFYVVAMYKEEIDNGDPYDYQYNEIFFLSPDIGQTLIEENAELQIDITTDWTKIDYDW